MIVIANGAARVEEKKQSGDGGKKRTKTERILWVFGNVTRRVEDERTLKFDKTSADVIGTDTSDVIVE